MSPPKVLGKMIFLSKKRWDTYLFPAGSVGPGFPKFCAPCFDLKFTLVLGG